MKMTTELPEESKTSINIKDDVISPVVLSAIERMSDEELVEEYRVLNAEIEAANQRLSSVENELFYRKNPECRAH